MKSYRLSPGSSIILDLIRALSAQVVLFGHTIARFNLLPSLHEPNFPWMQNIAVVVFFLLSGFLITYSTIRKLNQPGYGFRKYFIDRFARIYSAFLPAVFFVFMVDLLSMNIGGYTYSDAFNLKNLIANILMLQDYPYQQIVGTNFTSFGSARPFWTLAIEWWIYMSFGFFLLVIMRGQKVRIFLLVIWFLVSFVPLVNFVGGRGHGLTVFWVFGSLVYLVSRMDLLSSASRAIKISLLLALVGLGLYRAYVVMEAYDAIFAFSLAASLWLIIDLFQTSIFSEFFSKLVRAVANYSFTLYLIHFSILDFVACHNIANFSPYLLFFVVFTLSNGISAIIARYTETRLTSWLKLKLTA